MKRLITAACGDFWFYDAMRRIGAACLLLGGLVALMIAVQGCAATPPPTSLTVPMVLRPTDTNSAVLAGVSLKVYIQPFKDGRSINNRIGDNLQKPVAVPIYAGGQSPIEWLQSSIATELSQSGVNIAPSMAGPAASGNVMPAPAPAATPVADRQIAATVDQFWVEESPNYSARIVLTVQVQDAVGNVLWTGQADGESSTFGRSLSAEDYQQVMSNAVVKLVSDLISNSGFVRAITVAPKAQ